MAKKTPCIQCGTPSKGLHCRNCYKLKNTLKHIERIELEFDAPIKAVIQKYYFDQKHGSVKVCELLGLQFRGFRKIMNYLNLSLRTMSEAIAAQWTHDDGTRAEMTSQMFKGINEKLDNFGENNPAKRPEVRKKISMAKKKHNPGLNAMLKRCREMRINGEPTSIEQAMADELDRRHIFYTQEYPILKYSLDFALVDIKVDIECDGRGWHAYPHQKRHDRRRDRRLAELGWHTIRYSQDDIEDSIESCVDDLLKQLKVLGLTPPTTKKPKQMTLPLDT